MKRDRELLISDFAGIRWYWTTN